MSILFNFKVNLKDFVELLMSVFSDTRSRGFTSWTFFFLLRQSTVAVTILLFIVKGIFLSRV